MMVTYKTRKYRRTFTEKAVHNRKLTSKNWATPTVTFVQQCVAFGRCDG